MVILATSRSLSAAAFGARSRQQTSPSGLSSKITRLRQQQQQQQQQASSSSPPFQTAAFSTSARVQSPAGSPGGRSTSSESSSSSYSGGPTITEQSILSAFPRPNLSPTLHFSIFGGYFDNTSATKKDDQQKICGNCAGPHSTDFCPC
ncbi:hypothetical protein BX666DRAFT_2032822 [Dichotomocladium elegans]|nr:hypothetical protein BX666DRAFT_2032822 [Dichotomocladium elegans]